MKKLTFFFKDKRLPLIACVLTDRDVFELESNSIDSVDLIELRIDMFDDISKNHLMETLKTAKSKFQKPLISTVRDISEGGVKEIVDRLELYKSAISMSDLVDVEINSKDLLIQVKNILNTDTLLIGSYHNFDSTPDDEFLEEIVAKGKNLGADIIKIAVTAAHREDLLRLLFLTFRHKDSGIITMSMGDEGAPSRIISPIFGSLIIYGYATSPSAPGQLSISQLLEIFKLIKLR